MADGAVTFKDAAGVTVVHDTRAAVNGDLRPVVALGNDGDAVAAVEQFGALSVNAGYATWLYDSWSTALDTVDKWTVTGTAPSITVGTMVMPATVSTYNTLRAKNNIIANAGFAYVASGMQIEGATAGTGSGRFWGLGTNATTPGAAVLVQDGIGFELDQVSGALLAVTYAAGVRTTIATLTRPNDGATHRYAVQFRVTAAYWFVDGLQVPVATVNWPNVTIAELPPIFVRQNAATVTGVTFINHAHLTADTSRQGVTHIDPVIGTRAQTVKAPSTAAAAVDMPAVVALHPTSPLPAGTSTIGAVRAAPAGTGTITSVASSVTSVTVLAANAVRLGAAFTNDSTSTCFLSVAASPSSATSYTRRMVADEYYELPDLGMIYTGALTAVWVTAAGSLRVTEHTA